MVLSPQGSLRWRPGARAVAAALWGMVGLVSLHAERALAQVSGIGADYLSRPLVLPDGVMRFDGGPRWPDHDAQYKHSLGSDFHVLNPGFSIGIGGEFELGGVVPVMLSPQLQLENPRVYGLYQVQSGSTAYGIFAQLEPRFRGEGLSVVTLGAPFLLRLADDVRLDVGGFVDLELGDSGSALSVYLPAYLPVQITPQVYAGPELGLRFHRIFEESSGFAMPLGGFVGYTLERRADLYARVRSLDIQNGVDAVDVMLGVELYFGG